MPLTKINHVLSKHVEGLKEKGTAKGKELIVNKIIKGAGVKGPRYILEGHGDKEFIKMNSNSYLGMSMNPQVIKAEETAAVEFGVGPGAVRFISGTHRVHRDLEKKLAQFHGRDDAMIFSAAYVTILSVISCLTTAETIIISDELNHNCIINGVRLSRPADKMIYKHLDMKELEEQIKKSIGKAKRLLIITDGIFSMRGDYAPLNEIKLICEKYDSEFAENIILIVDDSHGVGAFGETGRGTEEYSGNVKVDVLIGTMGKAYGVNGGYVTSSQEIITYLRESSPMYIYSNPITCSEAAAVHKVLDILDSSEGTKTLTHLRALTKRFETGLKSLGFEIIESDHPIVPLMVRDTEKTSSLVKYLLQNGVIATGLNFPVVPKGDQSIRFQINGDHTEADIDEVLNILKNYK